MTTSKNNTTTTAPPPAWPDANGWGKDLAPSQARAAYRQLVALGHDVPPEVRAAVERVQRAHAVQVDEIGPGQRAQAAYAAALAAYIAGERDAAPTLDAFIAAQAQAAAAREAIDLVRAAQDAADNDAAVVLRAAAPGIVENLRPRWQRVLDEAVALADRLPAVASLGHLGADRDALLAWADATDLAAEYDALIGLRERLWLLTRPQWQPVHEGRHAAATLAQAPPPADADSAGRLLHLARVRQRVGLWWPTDEQIAGQPSTGRPKAMEVNRRGLREPSHREGDSL